jgi:hypothetical protein
MTLRANISCIKNVVRKSAAFNEAFIFCYIGLSGRIYEEPYLRNQQRVTPRSPVTSVTTVEYTLILNRSDKSSWRTLNTKVLAYFP